MSEARELKFSIPEMKWMEQELPFTAWFVSDKHEVRPVQLVKSMVGGPVLGEHEDGTKEYAECWFVGADTLEYLPYHDPLFPTQEEAILEALQDIDLQELKLRAGIAELMTRRVKLENQRDGKGD